MTPEAFKIKVMHFKNKLYRFCLRMLADEEEAADAVQDVYIKLWSMQDKLNTYDNPEAYAMRMARNNCLDRLKSANKRNLRLDGVQIISAYDPQAQYESRDTAIMIKSLIEQLPDLQRTIIHLRDVEQYEMNEIELITGLNANAIRVNLSRARNAIRESLNKIQHHEYQRS
jgi:RNA polymerase sigma-70 factor (ECF subfamily)